MSTFAIIENNVVENIVIADSYEVLSLLIPDAELIVEVTDATKHPYVGGEYKNNKFVPVPPYESWVFNEESWEWEPPVAKPEIIDSIYQWNEENLSWDVVDFSEITFVKAEGILAPYVEPIIEESAE